MTVPVWLALGAYLVLCVVAQEPNATFSSGVIQMLLSRDSGLDSTARNTACNLQISLCSTLCNNAGPANTCDPNTLEWNCLCSNGSTPGLQYYPFSMTGNECQRLYALCTEDNVATGTDQKDCKGEYICGLATFNDATAAANAAAVSEASLSAASASASAQAASASAASASAASGSAAAASASVGSSPAATATSDTTASATRNAVGASTTSISGTTTPVPASDSNTKSGALPGGTIAGIAVGAVAGGAALLAVIGLFCRNRRGWDRNHRGAEGRGYIHDRGAPMSLNPHNLDQHLASEEWAGIRQNVPQKQTAFHHYQPQQQQQPHRDSLSDLPDLRPEDAPGESRYGDDAATNIYSSDARTALHPASETVYHPRV